MSERYDADELEERNSALTRELELKTREIERLRARIAELESRPVSSPPARRGPLAPAAIWGSTALEPEAGETEDALGVPGLTGDEADRFMSGGAA